VHFVQGALSFETLSGKNTTVTASTVDVFLVEVALFAKSTVSVCFYEFFHLFLWIFFFTIHDL